MALNKDEVNRWARSGCFSSTFTAAPDTPGSGSRSSSRMLAQTAMHSSQIYALRLSLGLEMSFETKSCDFWQNEQQMPLGCLSACLTLHLHIREYRCSRRIKLPTIRIKALAQAQGRTT